MAHFAEIKSSDNSVLRVVVVNDSDVDANGGGYSEAAETWVTSNIPQDPVILAEGDYPDTYWKQTSHSGSSRYNYAHIGGTWDDANQAFIEPQPFNSFTLDSNFKWVAPVAEPATYEIDGDPLTISWDEDNTRWLGYKRTGDTSEYAWNNGTSVWETTGGTSPLE